MRIVKFKSSISVLSLIAAIGYSSVALADDPTGGAMIADGVSYVGESRISGDVSNANVIFTNFVNSSSPIANVYGGLTNNGAANTNTVTITGSTLSGVIGGGYSTHGSAIGNTVELSNSQIGDNIYGGRSAQGSSANSNSVTIDGGTYSGFVFGGRAPNGSAEKNTVNITSATISNVVYGGYSESGGLVEGNTIVITDSTTSSNVIGGITASAGAMNNTVLISGGSVGDSVFGGYTSGNGLVESNIVTIKGTASVTTSVHGGVVMSGTGRASKNQVNIDGGQIGYQIFGGVSSEGSAENNVVNISSGTITNNVYGGYSSSSGSITSNSITMTSGTASQLFGGSSLKGTAFSNSITLSGTASVDDAYGGYSGVSVGKNSVTIADMTHVNGFVVGGYSSSGSATQNSVTINGGTVGSQVYGGRSTSGNVSNNKVTMTDGSVFGNVYGASADGAGSANSNSVTITGGSLGHDVSGAWSQTGTVINNKVSISNATVERNVGGGYVENGGSNAVYNTVTLSSSAHVKGYAVGGFTASGSANNNTVTLEDAAIDNTAKAVDGAVYGGYTRAGDATGNTITLNGENITLGGAIYGGFDASGTGDAFTGNTMNLNAYRGSVSGIYNVENYNWLLPKNVAANEDALIHITGTDAVNLDNTKHTVALYNDGNVLNDGDTIYLIDKATGTPTLTTTSVQQGQFLVYDMTMAVEGDDLVLTVGTKDDKTPTDTGGSNGSTSTGTGGSNGSPSTDGSTGSVLPNIPVIPNMPSQRGVSINPRTKAFSEGRVASLGFTAQGSDLIASSIGDLRLTAAQSDKMGLIPFVVTEGSSQTYKTGSSVDVKGFNMAAGLAARHVFEAGHQLTAGAFFEYGQGTYDTFNSFTNYASVRGDGNTHYTGGGVLGRIDIAGTGLGRVTTLAPSQADGLYIEASLRAGRVKNKYDASNLVDPEGYGGQYDSSVTYFGAHGAVGYVFNFDEKQSLDAYGRYLYTHMGSDTVTIGKDRLNFDSSTSSRIQIGGRYSYQYNEQVKPFVGAAYEYEAKGDVSATAYNMKLAKPSLEGSTGIFEAGVSFKPLEAYKNIGVDVKGRGFAGERKGGGGNIKLTAEF